MKIQSGKNRNIIISIVYRKRKVNENNLCLNEVRSFGKK